MRKFYFFTFILFLNIIYSVTYKVKIVAEKKNAFFNELKEFGNQRISNTGYILSAIPDKGVICFEFLKNLDIEKVIKNYGNLSGEWLQEADGIFGGKVLDPSYFKIVYKVRNMESDEYKLTEEFKEHLKFLDSINGYNIFKINKEKFKAKVIGGYTETVNCYILENEIKIFLENFSDFDISEACEKMYEFSFFTPKDKLIVEEYRKKEFGEHCYYRRYKLEEIKNIIGCEINDALMHEKIPGIDIKIYKENDGDMVEITDNVYLDQGKYFYTIWTILVDNETFNQLKKYGETMEKYIQEYEKILPLSKSKNNNDLKSFLEKSEKIENETKNIEYPEYESILLKNTIENYRYQLDDLKAKNMLIINEAKNNFNKTKPTKDGTNIKIPVKKHVKNIKTVEENNILKNGEHIKKMKKNNEDKKINDKRNCRCCCK